MIKGLINYWSKFRSTIRGFDSSRQLALGVALGMVVGLVPKESLIPYALGCLLLLSTANLVTSAVSIFCFSWLGSLFDPISDRLGNYVLTFDLFEPTLAKLNELPIVPWTRFENTVVTGSLILGLILAIPVYRISYSLFERYGTPVANYFTRSRVGRLMLALPSETESV